MFDRPTLILPYESFRSFNGFGSFSTTLIVLFLLFVYLDLRYGIKNLEFKDNAKVKTNTTVQRNKNDNVKLTSYYTVPNADYQEPVEKANVSNNKATPAQNNFTPVYYFSVLTGGTCLRGEPKITRGNVLEYLDLHENVQYIDRSLYPDAIKDRYGNVVNDYWFYVFRPRTGTYGWIHPVNLTQI